MTHRMNDARRAVPCRAVRCHAVIPVVTCREGVVTLILSVQGRIPSTRRCPFESHNIQPPPAAEILWASKRKHYDKYYRSFAPFVMTLSGAVSEASAEALMRVMRAVARGDHSIVDLGPAR